MLKNNKQKSDQYCAVLVFGDIGRSPRMQNHALEIVKNTNYKTYMIGYLDFHNYGYTILKLNLKNRIILFFAKFYEQFFGSKCHFSFCVSQNMKKDLEKNWKIKSNVLYDKAQLDIFEILQLEQKHEVYKKLGLLVKNNKSIQVNSKQEEEETLFTIKNLNTKQTVYKSDRPILIISSTSWTKDEDFSILLNAMIAYEQMAQSDIQNSYVKLQLIITGKGPEKKMYENKIFTLKSQNKWQFIDIQTLWLEAEDYPKLLASADLGICLHYSSSGFDLPMKVVDMFGAGLPVFAINYDSIQELVQDSYNGKIFQNSETLFKLLKEQFQNWPQNQQNLEFLKQNAIKFREKSFEDEWKNVVYPIISQI
ncbi:hypothetical protein PPERSA_06040 [Pseudocohnilembus persalinus]|uniref:Beta-1,4-mannosyltransferase n=1 Tax=Pseudocohnilembus persalinus TaxID=266149 RepID=A0A0V0QQT4_PSEPJ|nr:hypothetical protein PPERSA_06040 [Pseudocohnilembus persalinus]|eukprot:KRX04487.1 hypothetical protein PPERSA_06040 [Pseudocohnilembus persalinus]